VEIATCLSFRILDQTDHYDDRFQRRYLFDSGRKRHQERPFPKGIAQPKLSAEERNTLIYVLHNECHGLKEGISHLLIPTRFYLSSELFV
jgi:hypothetical protein